MFTCSEVALAKAFPMPPDCAMMQIVYYDGQFDDARLNVTLAISAAQAGATTLNYCTVTSLIKVQKPPPPRAEGCLNQEPALCQQLSG